MSARERAEGVVADALKRHALVTPESDVLDDLSSAGFSVIETWELEELRKENATGREVIATAIRQAGAELVKLADAVEGKEQA